MLTCHITDLLTMEAQGYTQAEVTSKYHGKLKSEKLFLKVTEYYWPRHGLY